MRAKNWKTTAAGVGVFLAALGAALKAEYDGDPTTVADWGVVIAGAVTMVGLHMARDRDVTSEGRRIARALLLVPAVGLCLLGVGGCATNTGGTARDQVAPVLAGMWGEIESDAAYGIDAKQRDGTITPAHAAARHERLDRAGELARSLAD